jgi:hypothetical protein
MPGAGLYPRFSPLRMAVISLRLLYDPSYAGNGAGLTEQVTFFCQGENLRNKLLWIGKNGGRIITVQPFYAITIY